LVFGLCVFTAGYLYLNSLVNDLLVSQKSESVPYGYSVPSTTDILFKDNDRYFLLLLNFKEQNLRAYFALENSPKAAELSDYIADFTVVCNYQMLEYFVDAVGGIELENSNESLRFTGVQISDILTNCQTTENDIKAIIESLFSKLSETGFKDEYLRYIMSNSECDIDYTRAFRWNEYLTEMCQDFEFLE